MTIGDPTEKDIVVRSTSTVVTFYVALALAALLLAVPLWLARVDVFVFAVPPVLFVVWALWVLLYRPLIAFDSRRVRVVNVGRVHEIPWGRVVRVTQRASLVFELESARRVTAWGSPPVARRGVLASMLDRRTRPAHDPHETELLLESARQAAAPAVASPSVRWDVPVVVTAAVMTAMMVVWAASFVL